MDRTLSFVQAILAGKTKVSPDDAEQMIRKVHRTTVALERGRDEDREVEDELGDDADDEPDG